ncbi:hypothetical protein GZL_05349 [Streptomyces sp. 769]|nr:hypothetical protein GZL_05349 [Streptomyces sp. 769]
MASRQIGSCDGVTTSYGPHGPYDAYGMTTLLRPSYDLFLSDRC